MITLLENIFAETGIRPDMVFSGHVHNYQRLVKSYPTGKPVCYIVAGGGGYDELHAVADTTDDRFTNKLAIFEDVRLQTDCDDQHGFLQFSVEREENRIKLSGNYFSVAEDGTVKLQDSFEWRC